MTKKLVISGMMVALSLLFSSPCSAKYLALKHFGIEGMPAKFYSKAGQTFTGVISDPSKLHYMNSDLRDISTGDRIKATYRGNGKVELTNVRTGTSITIDTKVTASAYHGDTYSAYEGDMSSPIYRESITSGSRDISPEPEAEEIYPIVGPAPTKSSRSIQSSRPVQSPAKTSRSIPSSPQTDVGTGDIESVISVIKSRFSKDEIQQIKKRLNE